MDIIRLDKYIGQNFSDLTGITEEVTEEDRKAYHSIITTNLSEEQIRQITQPSKILPRQEAVLAVHWHPEHVPIELIAQRINATFPNKKKELIIPTQHNVFLSYGSYAGVEVDCYSQSFNRKIQLLLHFENSKLSKAHVLKEMISYTRKYRATQLFDLIHSFTDVKLSDRLDEAINITGVDQNLVDFLQIVAKKLEKLLYENESKTPVDFIKNKLFACFVDTFHERFDHRLIQQAQNFIKAVKKIVKKNFTMDYFYRTEEIIEETRSLGGCIVVPHPEQFWPILLAEYDVDGFEVWNPQSREYTEFLINVVKRQNKRLDNSQRPLLIFMGDDTHMSEKIKPPELQDPEKAIREIGVHDVWEDLNIQKKLISASINREKVIDEYKQRLA